MLSRPAIGGTQFGARGLIKILMVNSAAEDLSRGRFSAVRRRSWTLVSIGPCCDELFLNAALLGGFLVSVF